MRDTQVIKADHVDVWQTLDTSPESAEIESPAWQLRAILIQGNFFKEKQDSLELIKIKQKPKLFLLSYRPCSLGISLHFLAESDTEELKAVPKISPKPLLVHQMCFQNFVL